jgi:hypothetical protein
MAEKVVTVIDVATPAASPGNITIVVNQVYAIGAYIGLTNAGARTVLNATTAAATEYAAYGLVISADATTSTLLLVGGASYSGLSGYGKVFLATNGSLSVYAGGYISDICVGRMYGAKIWLFDQPINISKLSLSGASTVGTVVLDCAALTAGQNVTIKPVQVCSNNAILDTKLPVTTAWV